MTWSTRARTDGGMVIPSARAVFRLMTSSYLVGACTFGRLLALEDAIDVPGSTPILIDHSGP